ncbi:MAG: hypothetical protein HUK00_01640 [Bacteroidaceae bacterium]|nr:hypothetical protein [Bacteroidaceae bacterium]
MNKLKSLFTLLCAVVGMSVWAQTAPQVSTAENPKWYKIRCYNRGGFLTDAGSGSTLTHAAVTSDSYWRFEAGTQEGSMHMISKKGNAVSEKWKTGATAMDIWVLPNGVNQNGMSISAQSDVTANCLDANNQNNQVGTWMPSASDWQGTTWVFIEANPYAVIASKGEAATSIEEGKWYLLYNQGRKAYPSIEHAVNSYPNPKMRDATLNMLVGDVAFDKAHMLYKFTKNGDNYYVASGDGLYFSLGSNNAAVQFTPRDYAIKNITGQTDVFWLTDVTSTYVANGQEPGNNFVGWGTTEPGSNGYYQFLPVEICTQDVNYVLVGATDPIKTEYNAITLPEVGATVTIDGTDYSVASVTPSEIVNDKRTVTIILAAGSCVNYVHNGSIVKTVEDTAIPENTIELDGTTYFVTESSVAFEGGKNVCTATIKTLSEMLPTGYYTIASVTDRATFLYGANTLATNPNKFTLQSKAATMPGNNAIWKLSADDATLKISVLNQQGKGLVNNRNNTGTEYKEVTVQTFFKSNNSFYFSEAINASGGGQRISSGELHLTFWDGHPEATDNHWKFSPVTVANALKVVITGTDEFVYVTYGSDIALNGGFIVSDSPITTTDGFTATEVEGMKASMSIADGTLTVTYAESEDVPTLKAELQAYIDALPDYGFSAGQVGCYTQSTVTAVDDAKLAALNVIADANATADDVKTAKATLKAAVDALAIVTPVPGTFYAIRDHRYNTYVDGSSFAPAGHVMVGKVAHTAKNESTGLTAGQIWYFDVNMKGYSLATGFGLNNATEKAGVSDAQVFTFEAKNDQTGLPKTFAVRVPNSNTNTYWYIWDNTTTTTTDKYGYVDRNGEKYSANNCQFYIDKIKSLPVTIGSTGYASVNLPVATIIPEGVEAWVAGTEKDGKLPLSKIKDTNILPANCAVILYTASPDTYNFVITTSDDVVANTFSGTVAAQALNESVTTMVLGNDATSGVGLYNYAPTEAADKYIPGFKMYYETTTPASEVRVQWIDTTTAIEAAKRTDMREGEMYNLNGQQVTKANGLVIVNGRKFIVK